MRIVLQSLVLVSLRVLRVIAQLNESNLFFFKLKLIENKLKTVYPHKYIILFLSIFLIPSIKSLIQFYIIFILIHSLSSALR